MEVVNFDCLMPRSSNRVGYATMKKGEVVECGEISLIPSWPPEKPRRLRLLEVYLRMQKAAVGLVRAVQLDRPLREAIA